MSRMQSHIRTSKENREVVARLTNKLGLGAENVIARIAISHSLARTQKLDLGLLKDSGGKEYSSKVLFGEMEYIYIGMIQVRYNLHATDMDIAKYLKLHLDDGLELLDEEYGNTPIDGFTFLTQNVQSALAELGN